MSKENPDFSKAGASVSVTIHPSRMSKNGEKYCKVSRHTVTLENLIASIIEKNPGIDPYLIQHSAILLQQEILNMLQQGNSVNILDLGNLYIGMKGTVKGENPKPSDLPAFSVKFTPSALVKGAVSKLSVDKIIVPDTNPYIELITDEWSKEQNSSLTRNRTCLIKGKHLKLGGVENPVAFIMVDEEGKEVENQKPVYVSQDMITTNTPCKLIFYVPDELVEAKRYKIRISTSFIQKNQYRKNPVSTESKGLLIK